MQTYKFNQVQSALNQTFDKNVHYPIKRLLNCDRYYYPGQSRVFTSGEGSGQEATYTDVDVLAFVLGLNLLNHGFPQRKVIRWLRKAYSILQDFAQRDDSDNIFLVMTTRPDATFLAGEYTSIRGAAITLVPLSLWYKTREYLTKTEPISRGAKGKKSQHRLP